MAPRTKSCSTCRAKRIRCDATLPYCLMCERFGRKCPGVASGPLLVDMTKTARHGMQKRKKREAILDSNTRLITTISQAAMMAEAFYGRFLAYFTSEGDGKDIQNRLTWLHRLPLLSTDGTNEALALALQVAASAYCALDNSNFALTRYAWNLYGEALHTHARLLARARARGEVTVHMVSTSVLFSFFEAMQAKSSVAYRSHIYGAAKMLEVTGPGQCTQGVLCQLFYHLRTQLAFVHLTGIGTDTSIEVRRILYGTLEYTRLPIFQRLITHVTRLAEIYVQIRENEDDEMKISDLSTCSVMEDEVGVLWEEYCELAAQRNEPLYRKASLKMGNLRRNYRDAFTALTIAYFAAAYVLLGIVRDFAKKFSTDISDHCARILDVAKFLLCHTHDIGCAYMRMATPLLLVAFSAPTLAQRTEATVYFERWKTGSMKGISALALGLLQREATQAPSKKAAIGVSDGDVELHEIDLWQVSAVPISAGSI